MIFCVESLEAILARKPFVPRMDPLVLFEVLSRVKDLATFRVGAPVYRFLCVQKFVLLHVRLSSKGFLAEPTGSLKLRTSDL